MNSKSDINIEFSKALGKLIRKVSRVDRDEKICYGVTVSQCHIIEVLSERGLLSMNELSSKLGLAVSTLTRILDVMVRNGIVDRNRDSADRRKVLVKLSKTGEVLSKKLKKCSHEYSLQILEKIPLEKRMDIIESLKLLEDVIDVNIMKCGDE